MKLHSATMLAALALAGAAQPAAAQQEAYTAKVVNLRAGPDRGYPVVAVLGAGLRIGVMGCLANYTWCDVVAGGSRGWVYAGNINYAYQGVPQPVLGIGAVAGIAVLIFILDDYWGDHYRSRSWYPDRSRWRHPVPPPAPRVHRPAPPLQPVPPVRPAPPPARQPVPLRVPAQPSPQPHVQPAPAHGQPAPTVPSRAPRERDRPGPPGHEGPPGQRH